VAHSVHSLGDEKRLRLSIEFENATKDRLQAENKTRRVQFSTSTIYNTVNLQFILESAGIRVCLIRTDLVSTGSPLYDWRDDNGNKVSETRGMDFVIPKLREEFGSILNEKSFYVQDVHGQGQFFHCLVGSATITGSPDVIVAPRSCVGPISQNIQCMQELKLDIVARDRIQAIAQLIAAKHQHFDPPTGLFNVLTDYKIWYFFDFGDASTIRQFGPYGNPEGSKMFAQRLSALPGFPDGLQNEGLLVALEPPENEEAGDEGTIGGAQKHTNAHLDAEGEGGNETKDEHNDDLGDVWRELPSKPSHKSAKMAIFADYDDLDALCVDNSLVHMSFFVGA
jgi:hypothetical protein